MLLIEQVRKIEWSKSILWEVFFPDAPTPFNNWFPATDLDIEMGNVESENFNIGASSFSIPARKKERTLTLTFVDNATHSLVDWITLWMNSMVIVPGSGLAGSGVQTLNSAVKKIHISRLSSRQSPINVGAPYVDSYGVYPINKISFVGSSGEAKVNAYTITFIIAEVIKENWVMNMAQKGKVTLG